jgi:hypothetical protein
MHAARLGSGTAILFLQINLQKKNCTKTMYTLSDARSGSCKKLQAARTYMVNFYYSSMVTGHVFISQNNDIFG